MPRTVLAAAGSSVGDRRRDRPQGDYPSRGSTIAASGRAASLGTAMTEHGWVPTVIENEGGNRERSFDIYSRLLRDRIIMVARPIDDVVANLIVAQLIFLSAEDPEKEIQIYVNSPGGSVASGFAIYDTMQYVAPPVATFAVGRAASFGTVLLMAGAKGRRCPL